MLGRLKKTIRELKLKRLNKLNNRRIYDYFKKGRVAWTSGYLEFRNSEIAKSILDLELLKNINNHQLPEAFGLRLDERIVEYSWILSKIPSGNLLVLDAGSTFNFDFILDHPKLRLKKITIATLCAESINYNNRNVSYQYCDLRDIPFKDNCFDLVISQSTVEHIGMDNSMYGNREIKTEQRTGKTYEYLVAIGELIRVLKSGGSMFLTFPFGKYEDHGFFQQFDVEMVDRIIGALSCKGTLELTYFKYESSGWRFSEVENCSNSTSHNPQTGVGIGNDGAAHSRAICCIQFSKFK